MYSINIGDSRAILARHYAIQGWTFIPLTRDHKPDSKDEKGRISSCGGKVEPFKDAWGRFIGPQRIWIANEKIPGLAMYRSFGDNSKIILKLN